MDLKIDLIISNRKEQNMLKKFDHYGKAITLNFKGEDTFKTNVGGLLSLALMIGTFAYAIIKFVELIQLTNHTDTFNEIYNNLEDIGEITGEKMSYQVGYTFVDAMTTESRTDTYDESYFKINLMTTGQVMT